MTRRLTYTYPGIKYIKLKVTVTGNPSQLAPRKKYYNVDLRTKLSSEVDLEVIGVADHRLFMPQRGVVELNGERYDFVSKIVTNQMRNRNILRMADGKSIADRSIDYERLFTRMARITKMAIIQTSGGICDPSNVAGCMDESEMHVNVVKPVKKRVGQGKKTPPRSVILSVTGSLAEKTSKHFVINWDGGGKLTVARSRAEGDWDQLSVGQWIEATISRRITGEVVSALLVGTIEEPQGLSEEELSDSYSSLPAADLDPME